MSVLGALGHDQRHDGQRQTVDPTVTGRALITGASSGLGLYMANRLTDLGWDVTGFGRRPQNAIEGDVRFRYFSADLARLDCVANVAGRVAGPLDLIVHCAVCYPHHGADITDSEAVFRVNALNPEKLLRQLVYDQPVDRFLSVVVVNSESMFHADAQSSVYAASKAALRVLTAGLSESCRNANASIATILLGPLAHPNKITDLASMADKLGVTIEQITRLFLRKSNRDLVIDALIEFEPCVDSLLYILRLGRIANGMMCRLDGGSAGSLI
ncbi:SDR family NAD(P)-dependent oxidoreductase [Nocardia sp. NPDC047648]|uniref:SDR family NAD(P)-dependent oxidoreductase n=1 Tax=Nocardia sp. NPDC047648 TaxID=3155625 RepID=UPI0033FF6385